VLKEILPDHVKIVDCSKAVAQQVERILKRKALLRPEGFDGETTYYCTGESNTMQSFVGHGNAIKKVSILG
jgi:glutamate racemase